MPDKSHADEEKLAALAELLRAHSPEIIDTWMTAVRDDPEIPVADHLTVGMLRDHFPQILTELSDVLETSSIEEHQGEIGETGREHGSSRSRQGYRIDEMLRELVRMRRLVIEWLRNAIPGLAAEQEFCAEIVSRFFDRISATSAREYVRLQEGETLLRSQQLQAAYEQVAAATAELRHVSQSRVRLLRGISHELRNALQALALVADSLVDEIDAQSRVSSGFALRANAIRLQRLLDRLQEFSTVLSSEAKTEPEAVDLAAFLKHMEGVHWAGAARKGLDFEFSAAAGPAGVTIDRAKLKTIADVIVANAIEYTEHGSVRVKTLYDLPGRWILRVEDTGRGIAPPMQELVFSEFHHDGVGDHEGLGLGLVLARHLAHLLDGEITFRSTPGQGSCFEVNLPLELRQSSG